MSVSAASIDRAEIAAAVREVTDSKPIPALSELGLPPEGWTRLFTWAITACRHPWHGATDVLPEVEVDAKLASLEVRLRGNAAGLSELDEVVAHQRALRDAQAEAAFALGFALGSQRGSVLHFNRLHDHVINELHLLSDAIQDIDMLDEMWKTAPMHPRKRQRLAGIIAEKCDVVGNRIERLAAHLDRRSDATGHPLEQSA